jgi:hypothetical protein
VDGHRYADDSEPSWYSGSQYSRAADPEVSGSHALGTGAGTTGAGTTSGNIYDSGIQERPSGAFRLPEQRPGTVGPATTGSHALPTEPEVRTAYDSVRMPVRGPEYPAVRPGGSTSTLADAPGVPAAPPPSTYGSPAPPSTYGSPDPSLPIAEPTSLVPPVSRFEQSQQIQQAQAQQAQAQQAQAQQAQAQQAQAQQTHQAQAQQGRSAESVYSTRRPISSFVVAAGMVVLMIPVVRLLFSAAFKGSASAATIVPAVLLTLGFALTGIGLFAVAGGRPLNRDAWLRPPVAYLPAGLILLVAAGLAVA